MKRVTEFKDAKNVNAWIVLDKDKKHVATVRSRFMGCKDGLKTLVNVYNYGDSNPDRDKNPFREKMARGDVTDALAGLSVCGVKLYGHCENYHGSVSNGLPLGVRVANWRNGQAIDYSYVPGLLRLESFGFKVIQVI